ncbi:hypothetical protein FQZ97_1002820 [compost metagenome]
MTLQCQTLPSILDMARLGQLQRIKRITIEKVNDHTQRTKTEIVATVFYKGYNLEFPVVMIENHPSDELAMSHLLDLFQAMLASGTATREQIAGWRRKLIVRVQ